MNRNNMGRGPGINNSNTNSSINNNASSNNGISNGNNNNNSNNGSSNNNSNNINSNNARAINASSTGGSGNLATIAELRPSMRGFNLESAEPRRTYDNQLLTTFLVADKTGSIVLIIWGEEGALLKNGDLVRIQGGEAKLFKGLIQLSTSKFGKYKKIGEDTMLFVEKPNWSEFEWTQDPNGKPGVMIPITPQLKQSMANNGIPSMLPGGSMQQQRGIQGINQQASISPPFRGDQRQVQRPFSQTQGGAPNGNPHSGLMPNANSGNKGIFGAGNPPLQQQQQSQQQQSPPQQQQQPPLPQQQQQQQQQQQLNVNGINAPPLVAGSGPAGNRPHIGQYQGHGINPSNPQSQNQNQNQNQSQSQSQNLNSSNAVAINTRHLKHNKHSKIHRDLDAPDAYPSPRTGLANSVDEFAQEMKLVSSQGSIGLGVGQLAHSGGPSGPGHIRKKPKVEME
ncbi:SOSS complex subunit B2 [Mortierella sp. AM989]|nr:SOSS complex subunit B2 [Mortierella sp. AM989]